MRQPARRSKGRQEAARQAASETAKRAAASALATHLSRSRSIHCTHRIDCSQRSQLPFPPPAYRARPLHRLYLEHWTRRRLDWLRGSAWASIQMPPCTGAHLHGEQAAGKTRATGADQARRCLRNRKKRCSQMLQRKGTMPMLRSRKSNSLRCDLRMSRS
jgi:hypothetical protein